jgi:hypothetical protein
MLVVSMMMNRPVKLVILGFFLVLFGFVAPLLMVLHIVPNSLLLSFLSYGASIAGLMLGLVGAAMFVRRR